MSMKTRKEIAALLGIKESTLASRLWEKNFQPTSFQAVKTQFLYDEKAVEEIKALFKGRAGRPGRPKKEKKP